MHRRPTPIPSRLNRRFGATLLSAAGWCAALPAQADDTASVQQLPQVEVVGTTLVEGVGTTLDQVPSNVRTLSAHDIAAQSSTNLADLLDAHLGAVSVSDGSGSPYQNDVNYRGFQASSLLGAPVGLSVYFDGVRMNEPFGSVVNWDLIPLNAVAQVQLMPGSNPVFGLNTLGGALVLTTKNGASKPGTSVSVGAGSYGRQTLGFETGWVDDAHNTDHFITGNFDQQNGWRDHSGQQVRQLFGKSRWHSDGHATDLELSYALADNLLNGTQALPLSMLQSNPAQAYTWPDSTANQMALLNLKFGHAFDDDHRVDGNVYYRKTRSASQNSNAGLDDNCSVNGGSTDCSNAAPNGTALNLVTDPAALAAGYANFTGNINTALVDATVWQQTWGANVQWSSFAQWLGHDNSLTAGVGFDHTHIDDQQSTYLAQLIGGQTVVAPTNPQFNFGAAGFRGSHVIGAVQLAADTTDLNLFGSDTLKLTDRLSVTASGNFVVTALEQAGANQQFLGADGAYTWSDSTGTYYNPDVVHGGATYFDPNSGMITAATANGTPGPEVHSLNGSHHFHRFNPSLGVNFNPSPDLGLFADYSESMRAPTAIELSCANPNAPCALPTGFNGDPDLKAVVAKTVEFGARGRFGAARWNAAVYDTQTRNDIEFIAANASTGYFDNVGNTERRGFEFGIEQRLGPWQLAADYGFVNAVYRSAFTTAGGEAVGSGDRIPGIPAQSLKLRAAYDVNPRLQVGVNQILASWQVAHGNESNSDPAGVVPGYGVTNLDLHLRASDRISLVATVNNLFNKRYATYGLAGVNNIYSPTLAAEQMRTPAAPRIFWLGLSYSLDGKRKAAD